MLNNNNKNTIVNNNTNTSNGLNLFQTNLTSHSSSSLGSSQQPNTTNTLRPPFYALQNNASSPSLTSQASTNNMSLTKNNGTSQFNSTSTDLFFNNNNNNNKYNHLAQYQKQQSFLTNYAPPFNLPSNGNSANTSLSVLSPNNSSNVISPNNIMSPANGSVLSPNQHNTNNISFNQSLAFFNKQSHNTPTSTAMVPHPVLNPLYRISAPTTPAPLPPGQFSQNPGYFMPPTASANNAQREQEELDNGFFNLFDSTFKNTTTSAAPNSKPTVAQPTGIPHRYNQSHFNTSSNHPQVKHLNNNSQPLTKAVTTKRISKKKLKNSASSVNLIDLDTWIDKKSSSNQDNMSIFDLFDPLSKVNLSEQKAITAGKVEEEEEEGESETEESESEETEEIIKQQAKDASGNVVAKKCSLQRFSKLSASSEGMAANLSNLSRIENFKLVEQLNIAEFESFNKSINKLSQELKVDSRKNLSNLIVFSPLLDCPLSNQRKNIKIVVRYANSEANRFLQQNITPSFNATVETVVYHVLSLFGIDDLDTNKYLLKIHGCEEYLPINANLSDLKYLHECLTLNKEPVLILTELTRIKTELSSETEASTNHQPFRFSNKFEKNKTLISKLKLEKLLQGLVQDRKLIEEAASNSAESNNQLNNLSTLFNLCINLKEKCKQLASVICNVHFNCMEQVVDRLEFSERSLRNYEQRIDLKDKQPLMMTVETDEDYCIVNRHSWSGGSGHSSSSAMTDDSLQQLYSNLVETASDALHAALLAVNCAAESFNLPFKLKPVYFKSTQTESNTEDTQSQLRRGSVQSVLHEPERVEIIQAEEKLFLYFKGLSRLYTFLTQKSNSSIGDLYIKFSIHHGTQQLDSQALKLERHEKLVQRKVDFFTTDTKIQFRDCDLCLIPREAILVIQLCTLSSQSSNSQSSQLGSYSSLGNADFSEQPSGFRCLAWTSKSLFDENLELRHGDYLLSFYLNDMPTICTSASNIFANKSPVIQICLMSQARTKYVSPSGLEHTTYVYPSLDEKTEQQSLQEFDSLQSTDTQERLLAICNKSVIARSLEEQDRDLLHRYYLYLNGIPNALAKVYLSCSSWDYSSMVHFIAYVRQCDPVSLSESLELLLPGFTETELRRHAVRSLLQQHSEETLALYLPQFLEALKFEHRNDSELLFMLLTLAFRNIRFAHKLYWQCKEFKSRSDDYMYLRYEMLGQALMYLLSKPMCEELQQENALVDNIDRIGQQVKRNKDNGMMMSELELFMQQWRTRVASDASVRMPYNISYCTKEIEIKSCSVISSFTQPLKLVFKNIDPTANSFYTIYKIGDDLRQDMFVLQLINVMNQLWILEEQDLSVLTFTCMQTAERRGFIEMVTNAETLKEIQKGEVMKAFKTGCINEWLKSHNPNPNNFKKAVRNFTKSCAAYSVATYLLGIGDRHNDNIMVKYTGHMFHIDFGKYLGDAQTFVGIKRDRTPMLFTLDMFYVINQGKQANALFQGFVEMCCKAFQILRKNYHLLLTLIELMISSGIPGLNKNAIQFVYKNLMIDMDEDHASNAFKKLIHESLSRFPSFNFAIHTLAQPKTVSSGNYFSFVTHTFNLETDGRIVNVTLDEENAVDTFKVVVTRETEYDSNEVYRTFDEFCELYQLLTKTFPSLRLTETPPFNRFKETKQLARRRQCVHFLLKDLMNLQPEISQSDIVYTFFHSILRDQKEDFIYLHEKTPYDTLDESSQSMLNESQEVCYFHDIKGQIKVKLKFKDNKFFVNCLQCRNLRAPNNQSVSSLKPYVKCYLRPDSTKATKKKVQALFNGSNPIFTETMEYDISLIDFKNRTLEVSVINNNNIKNEKIGSVEIRLYDLDFKGGEYVKWYELR